MSVRLADSKVSAPRRFSRPWCLSALWTFGWVAVITVLIWVYADLDRTETKQISARLAIHADSTRDAMVVLGPTTLNVTFQVKGSSYAISQLQRRGELRYDAAKDLGEGAHPNVSMKELLGRLDELRTAPIEIVGVPKPRSITVHVERTKPFFDVPVEPSYPAGEPEAKPVIDPAKVDLYVPVSQVTPELRDPGPLRVPVDITDVPPGEPVTRLYAVAPPPRVIGAIIRPPKVSVTLEVAQRPAKREISVPVRVQSPKEWLVDDTWTRYQLDVKNPLEWHKIITVTGNRIDLEKLRPEDIRAYIVLTDDSKQPVQSWLPGEVRIEFPEGLNVQAEAVAPVSYRLRKRSATPPPP